MLAEKICEQARLSKDPRFDGRFFTGVLTTGIYCRSICPAPAAKAENVVYFAHASAAEQAGLRPCLRCHPESAPGSAQWQGSANTINSALRIINSGYLAGNRIKNLADMLNCSSRHLYRLFITQLGVSPKQVENTRRLLFAKQLLHETRLPIHDIAFASGYDSQRQFNHAFKKSYQRTPSTIRRAAENTLQANDFIPLYISYRPPYAWEALLDFFAYRAIPGIEWIDGQRYLRSIPLSKSAGNHETGIIEVTHQAKHHRLFVKVFDCKVQNLFLLKSKLERLFDTVATPLSIDSVLKKTILFGATNKSANHRKILNASPGLRIPGCWDPFELAIRTVIGQQISVKGATTIATRIVERLGKPVMAIKSKTPGTHFLSEKFFTAFPPAKIMSKANLQNIGLTQSRIRTIQDLSRAVLNEEVSFSAQQTVEEFKQNICRIKGIGQWTAEYIAMRALNDPDAFPRNDRVIDKTIQQNFGNIKPEEILKLMDQCRPWRAYAAILLWREAALSKG